MVHAKLIAAEEALLVADERAQAEGWGRVDEQFVAVLATTKVGEVWSVQRKSVTLGYDFWFLIDKESGAIIELGRRGSR